MSRPDHPAGSFLEELKRRKVVRAVLLYAAAAFAVLQGADLVLPIYDAPAWAMRLLLGVALAGLPLVLGLAWALDLRRDGGDVDASADDSPDGNTRWLSPATLAVAAVLVLASLAAGFTLRGVGDAPGADHDVAVDTRAVAALPFANRSGLPEDRYFIDGIHDDILTQLHRIGALRVISRTSVEEYRDRSMSMLEVGRQLGVGSILEGGIQRSGDQVRINMQLIDVSTGQERHVWAETYDRRITAENLFDVQSQIAIAVAGALSAQLQPAELTRLARRPTTSTDAYDAYLQALAAFHRYELSPADPGWAEAVVHLRRAVTLDPGFAEAWARLGLALTHSSMGNPAAETLKAEALAAAAEARRLAPTLPGADLVEALTALVDGAQEVQIAAARRAHALAPDQPEVLLALGEALHFAGRFDEVMPVWTRAVALDPRSAQLAYMRGRSAAYTGDLDLTRAELRRSLALAHGPPALAWVLPTQVPAVHAVEGYDAALALLRGALDRISARTLQTILRGDPAFVVDDVVFERVVALSGGDASPGFRAWAEGWRARLQGRTADARTAFARAAAADAASGAPLTPTAAVRIAHQHALAGQDAEARKLLADVVASAGSEEVSLLRRVDLLREIAFVHAALGDADAAAATIMEARRIGVREIQPVHLRTLPQWEPVRTGNAFRNLLRETQ